MPNQRVFATNEGARRFAETWAAKWDADIRRIVPDKGRGYGVGRTDPQVLVEAATKDRRRRSGSRKDWFKRHLPQETTELRTAESTPAKAAPA